MPDHFDSPRRLIKRARKHAQELEDELSAYMAGNPYRVFTEKDSEPGWNRQVLRLTTPFPADGAVIISDLLKNLRSALDNSVYAATVFLTKGDPSGTKFPFGDDEIAFEGDLKRKCRDVPVPVLVAIRTLKPYKGGNDTLFCLNKIRNRKDHRVLIEPGLETKDIAIVGPDIRGPAQIFPSEWDRTKNEVVILRVGPGGRAHYGLDFTGSIALRDVPGLDGLQAGTFAELINEVERAIDVIEAAARAAAR